MVLLQPYVRDIRCIDATLPNDEQDACCMHTPKYQADVLFALQHGDTRRLKQCQVTRSAHGMQLLLSWTWETELNGMMR